MAPSRTKTIKNKHAAPKKSSAGGTGARPEGVVKSKLKNKGGKTTATQVKGVTRVSELLKKKKKRVYTEAELGIPKLNKITPVGVQKPKGKKKGKVFVNDPESMNTLLAIVQAEKEGQIESKMMKARQLEEIREARRIEAEKKEAERNAKLEETKESLRKKRKRPQSSAKKSGGEEDDLKEVVATGSKAIKPKKKKKVAFAE
ncbi:hypothetical protein VTK73DRAFT_9044 [Phialemonium thermophilum]|uniref:60S ribosomal subunit assembly/export protein LOC1 n=1 Tax=Phialemonium thermophilum TaxID=223376 RepID=A0ABR3XLM2_9PEZI